MEKLFTLIRYAVQALIGAAAASACEEAHVSRG
jgi:hypothetical protein